MRQAGWRRIQVAVPIILLAMILSRLVWMQLRSYAVDISPRAIMAMELGRFVGLGPCDRGRATVKSGLSGVPVEMLSAGQRAHVLGAFAWLAPVDLQVLGAAACRAGGMDERNLIRVNQALLIATVFSATLMTRFLCGSWTMALINAAMLMSRGSLLHGIGGSNGAMVASLLVAAFACAGAHYFRTGAWFSLIAMMGVAALAGGCERALLPLSLAMPCFLTGGYIYRRRLAGPVVKRWRLMRRFQRQRGAEAVKVGAGGGDRRSESRLEVLLSPLVQSVRWALGMEATGADGGASAATGYDRGTALKTLKIPFLLWAYIDRRWARLSLAWLLVAALVAVAIASWHWGLEWAGIFAAPTKPVGGEAMITWSGGYALSQWLPAVLAPLDAHLLISLVILLFCAAQSPASGLPGYLEESWLLICALVLVAVGAFGADVADAFLWRALRQENSGAAFMAYLPPRPVLVWFEPVILALASGGLYNLLKVFDTRVAETR